MHNYYYYINEEENKKTKEYNYKLIINKMYVLNKIIIDKSKKK